MNEKNEIRIEDFQFQSLRKFMSPLYWRLRHAELLPPEEQTSAVMHVIRDFFIRLRLFRRISIEQMALTLKKSNQEILDFESRAVKSVDLEHSYCDVLQAWHEFEYFDRRVREFKNPETRVQKQMMAKNLLKQYGIIMPDIDLSRLNAPSADIIQLFKK